MTAHVVVLAAAAVLLSVPAAQGAAPYWFSGWKNTYDKYFYATCPVTQAITGLYSVHHNRYEDRVWTFRCQEGGTTGVVTSSGYINDWDASFYYSCPSNKVLVGMGGYHDNRKEDRRWFYHCKGISTTSTSLTGCAWTSSWVNGWDAELSYTLTGKVIVGMGGIHDNRKEDRLWKVRSCSVTCKSPWIRSGARCVCPYGYYTTSSKQCIKWRTCSAGQYQSTRPSSTSNRGCSSCKPGTYQNAIGHSITACKRCSAGTVSGSYGRSSCTVCTNGYQNEEGQSSCKSCSNGYYRSSSTAQTRCQAGYYCPGSCSRKDCPAGSRCPSTGMTSAVACTGTTYQDKTRQTSCKSCVAGFYYPSRAAAGIKCQAGYACSKCVRSPCRNSYQDGSGASSCKPWRSCGAGQYVTRGPTASTDRQCGSCNLGSSFQSSTSHTRTSCNSVQVCKAGTHQSAPPTLTSDRKCLECGRGTFTATAGLTKCASWRYCGAGQYVGADGTSTTDRLCLSCARGATYQVSTRHTSKSCTPVSKACGVGFYQVAAPTLTTDRRCARCGSGYTDVAGQSRCNPWATCQVGEEQSKAPTSTSDRKCRACNGVDRYQDTAGQKSCKVVTVCGSNEYTTRLPTRTSDRKCSACLAQSACRSNQFLTGACPGVSGTSNRKCANCHPSCATCTGANANQCVSCPNGQVVDNGKCTNSCPNGKYKDGKGSCQPCNGKCATCNGPREADCITCKTGFLDASSGKCVSTCPSGSFFSGDRCRTCKLCADGTYASGGCNGDVDTICKSWSTCHVGEEEDVRPTSTSDRKCRNCDTPTKYQNQAGQTLCKVSRVCQEGQYESVKPTLTSNRQCQPCKSGSFQNRIGQTSCIPCPAGTSQPQQGLTACAACGLGKYQPSQAATSCKDIEPGFYGTGGDASTRTGQKACPAGYYCPGGSAPRTACPPETWQAKAQQTKCTTSTKCAKGQRQSAPLTSTSDRKCTGCPTGSFQPEQGHSIGSCRPHSSCSPGQEVATDPTPTSDRVCRSCTTGKFAATQNQASCKLVTVCRAGSVETTPPTSSTDRRCAGCTLGRTFQDADGQSNCKPVTSCTAGQREVKRPTLTSDRKCGACNGVSEYQDEAGSSLCKAVRTCRAGEYAKTAPTPSSDRVCLRCTSGTFLPDGSHTKSACAKVTVCGPGTREVKPPTLTSDRVCDKCKVGETYQDQPGETSCKRVSLCDSGEFEHAAPSISSDRVCKSCEEGFFQVVDDHSRRVCEKARVCPKGEAQVAAATEVSDTRCEPCDGVREFQAKEGQKQCDAVTECKATEYEVLPPSAVADRQCRRCPVKKDCNANEYLAGTCGGADPTSATRCAACHGTCAACTGPSSTQCTSCSGSLLLQGSRCTDDCGTGKYGASGSCRACDGSCENCSGPGADACTSCKGSLSLSKGNCVTTCPDGTFSKDNICVPCRSCPQGQFAARKCSGTADTACDTWAVCQIGQKESVPPSGTRDRQCTACEAGAEFQPSQGQAICLPVSRCAYPDVESVKPTVSTDRQCACDKLLCSRMVRNAYLDLVCRPPSNDEANAGIEDCCRGQLESELRNSVEATKAFQDRHTCDGCQARSCACTEGFREDTKSSVTSCIACDGKTGFAEGDGATVCESITKCQRGEGEVLAPSPSTDRICARCAAGTLDDDGNGATPCVAGAKGTYIPEGSSGKMDTFLCPPGTADTDSDPATRCEKCTLGVSYQDKAGQLACKAVTTCAAGEGEVAAMTEFRDRNCQPCPQGTFKTVQGQSECQEARECAAGFEETSSATPTSDRVCERCKSGFFKASAGQNTKCVPATECRAGEEEVIPPTPDGDRQCSACEPQVTFKAASGQDTNCVRVKTCGPDQFLVSAATVTKDAVCQDLTVCKETEFESKPETLTEDRECSPCTSCPSGRFEIKSCTAVSDAQCEGCTPCPQGKYQVKACTKNSDAICLDCEPCRKNFYVTADCSATAQIQCEPLTACGRDEYEVVAASSHGDRKCAKLTECKAGEYESVAATETSDRKCKPYSTCAAGQQETQAPGPASDRVCQVCPAGFTDHDADGSSLSGCRSCDAGVYTPAGSVGDCSLFKCAAGYADEDRDPATRCTKCIVGESYAPSRGLEKCLAVNNCPLGSEEIAPPTPFADRVCNGCVEGLTFNDKVDNGRCKLVRRCTQLEYQVGPEPTVKSDRVCKTATVCSDGEYISSPLTRTSNRVCAPITSCEETTQYEATPPSLTSDRECEPISICDQATEFQEFSPTPTSDRVCATTTLCASDEYEVRAPTNTSDRLCSQLYPIRLYFDADFDSVINTTVNGKPMAGFDDFSDSFLAAVGAAELDNTSFVDLRLTKGSIILDVFSKSEETRYQIYELMIIGAFSVRGFIATPCPTGSYLTNGLITGGDEVTCKALTKCHRLEFIAEPATAVSDLKCNETTICDAGSVEVSPPTETSDRVCEATTVAPTEAGASVSNNGANKGMSVGVIAAIAICCLLLFAIIAVFAVWQHRKRTKDARDAQFIEKVRQGAYQAEMDEGNQLLRQLSRRGGNVQVFDNPTFAGATNTDDGYLATAAPTWLVGPMSRTDAEKQLAAEEIGDFVLRESTTNGNYVLTLVAAKPAGQPAVYEHHKLYQDAGGRYMLNGDRLSSECHTPTEVVMHLSQSMDGTSALLRLPGEQDMYGKVAVKELSNDDFYGAVARTDGAPATEPYMRGPINRKEAETELQGMGRGGSFIIRESSKQDGSYAVSVLLDDGRMEHHKLAAGADGVYTLNGNYMSVSARTVPEVVEHLYDNIETLSQTLARDTYDTLARGVINPRFDGSLNNPSYAVGSAPPVGANHYDMPSAGATAAEYSELPRGLISNPSYMSPATPEHAAAYMDPAPFPEGGEGDVLYSNSLAGYNQ